MTRKKADQKENINPFPTMNTSGAVEKVTDAEIVTDAEFDGLPLGIVDRVDNAIYDFMTYQNTPPIEDMTKEKQNKWAACCMYIGKKVFKSFVRESERMENGKYLPINPGRVEAIIPLWVYYCMRFNKTPLVSNFIFFSGVGETWLYSDRNHPELTPERTKILQKVHDVEKAGIKESLIDGSKNPTMGIAILNNEHGYGQTTQITPQEIKIAISAIQLPKLTDNSTPG